MKYGCQWFRGGGTERFKDHRSSKEPEKSFGRARRERSRVAFRCFFPFLTAANKSWKVSRQGEFKACGAKEEDEYYYLPMPLKIAIRKFHSNLRLRFYIWRLLVERQC